LFFIFNFRYSSSLHQIIMSSNRNHLNWMEWSFYWLTCALWFAFLRYLNMCCCRGCLKHPLILYRNLEPCISVAPWEQFLFRISAVWWYLWVLMRSSALIFVSVPAGFHVLFQLAFRYEAWTNQYFVQSFVT
jgi:hypothetical protein